MRARPGRSHSFVPEIAHTVAAVVALRIAASLAWIDSALVGKDAKFSADFIGGVGLADRVTSTFVHTAISPTIAGLLQTVVVPNARIFAVLIAVGHLAAGVLLFFGLFTRLGGLLCISLAAVNIAVAGGAGTDTIGFNSMLIVAGAIACITGAGRVFGIDRILLERNSDSRFFASLS